MSNDSEKFDRFWKYATIALLIVMVLGFFVVIGLYIKYRDKIEAPKPADQEFNQPISQ